MRTRRKDAPEPSDTLEDDESQTLDEEAKFSLQRAKMTNERL